MKRKVIKCLIISMMMAVVLTGCGHNADDPSSGFSGGGGGGSSSSGGYNGPVRKVGIINNPPSESGYRYANVHDFERVFTVDNGYNTTACYAISNEQKLEAAATMINQDIEYLLISPSASYGWYSVLSEAKTKGVKVFFFDRFITVDDDHIITDDLYECAVISSMEKEGETAVNWLKSQGIGDYRVIHLQGAMGSEAQIGRTAALNAEFTAGTMKKVIQQTAAWDETEAKNIVESVIADGKAFNVIYAENDNMAKGAVDALDAHGISHGVNGNVIIISFDCNKWAMRKVLSGDWNCDVQCSPFQADLIDGFIKSGNVPSKIVNPEERAFDAETITQTDIDKYGLGD